MSRVTFLLLLSLITNANISAQKLFMWHGGDMCSPEDQAFTLAFEDHFDGNELDTSTWQTYLPCSKTGDDQCLWSRTHCTKKDCNEVQIFKDENVSVADGNCNIAVSKEKSTWQGVKRKYTSGMIYSKAAFTKYGKFEIRCDMPDGNAYWPNFWMYGWSTELDVAEYGGDTDTYTVGVHKWDSRGSVDPYVKEVQSGSKLTRQMHVYSVVFDPYRVKFYLDDELVGTLHKYSTLAGKPVTACGYLAPQVLVENYVFPKAANPLNIIADVSIWYWADQRGFDFKGDTLRIDYIKYFERDYPCAHATEEVIVEKDKSMAWSRTFRKVVIKAGATLTLKNTDFYFDTDGSIEVEDGGSLVLKNTQLTSCNERLPWRGITVQQGGSLRMDNSTVAYAAVGIALPESSERTTLLVKEGSKVVYADIGLSVPFSVKELDLKDTLTIENCSTAIQSGQRNRDTNEMILMANNDSTMTIDSVSTRKAMARVAWKEVLSDMQLTKNDGANASKTTPSEKPLLTSKELEKGVLELLIRMRMSL